MDDVEFTFDKIPPLHQKLFRMSTQVVELFNSAGVNVRQGAFTNLEDKIIQQNMEKFLAEFPDKSVDWLLGFNQPSKNTERRIFLNETQFLARLAHRLPDRLLDSVRRRARKVCLKCAGRRIYQREEVEQLTALSSSLGPKHVAISQHVDRTPSSIERKLWRLKNSKKRKLDEPLSQEGFKIMKDIMFNKLKPDQSIWDANIFWSIVLENSEFTEKTACLLEWSNVTKELLTLISGKLFARLLALNVQLPDEIEFDKLALEFHLPNACSVEHLFETALSHFLKMAGKNYADSSFKKKVRRMAKFYELTDGSINQLFNELIQREKTTEINQVFNELIQSEKTTEINQSFNELIQSEKTTEINQSFNELIQSEKNAEISDERDVAVSDESMKH